MKSVVQQRPGGMAFQSFGGALYETDLTSGRMLGEVEKPQPAVRENQRQPTREAAPAAVDVTKPGAIKRAIRGRIREIKAELKRHAALKSELNELERLLAAATTKPASKIRALRTG